MYHRSSREHARSDAGGKQSSLHEGDGGDRAGPVGGQGGCGENVHSHRWRGLEEGGRKERREEEGMGKKDGGKRREHRHTITVKRKGGGVEERERWRTETERQKKAEMKSKKMQPEKKIENK